MPVPKEGAPHTRLSLLPARRALGQELLEGLTPEALGR